mmetsp:Transcript_8219/g.21146  ORF Transcript_8219/g.21146 Transcript_8219/m.21146 type:complete len:445 (-) Transcript_8219:831-2165(-)
MPMPSDKNAGTLTDHRPPTTNHRPRTQTPIARCFSGGHRASANAIRDAFDEVYPDTFECEIVDIWTDHAVWPFTQFVPAYKTLAKNPFLWRIFWIYGKFPISRWFQEVQTRLTCFGKFSRCIEASKPDIVISVHPLTQDIPIRALKILDAKGLTPTAQRGEGKTPFVTVVTDLGGAHPCWFDKRADLCFVPSDPVRDVAIKCGMPEGKLRQHGLPLRAGFWTQETRSKEVMRKELGLETDLPTTLVVGGGDGVGGIAKIAEALGDELKDVEHPSQLVVVCGSNAKIKKKIEEMTFNPKVKVSVQGFVSNMEDFMAASDCIVTKAGPGTIAEAMCRGLPTMLSCFLPGQEAGNVPFVTEGGFGEYSNKPGLIASTVADWIAHPDQLSEMQHAAKEAGRPSATYDIARDIAAVVLKKEGLPQGNEPGAVPVPLPVADGRDGALLAA